MVSGTSSRTRNYYRHPSRSNGMVGSGWRYEVWPVADNGTGRSWTIGELRSRDFDTLHQLWWICVKDRNRLATEKIERKRLEAGYGDYENQQRDKTVQETMKAILDTLAERHQAYQEAFELAKHDPNIDLSRTDGPQYEAATPYVRLVLSLSLGYANNIGRTRRNCMNPTSLGRSLQSKNHRRPIHSQSQKRDQRRR
jgi:hypothetical protein